MKHRIAKVPDLGLEVADVFSRIHLASQPFDLDVIGKIQLGLDNHRDAAVTTDHGVEKLGVVCRRCILYAAVSHHHTYLPHRHDNRAKPHVATMAIDT